MSGQFILMELLEEFINVCNENNITFWLDWGTLLGQIRHNNVIPWDNDCDVCMLETDYLYLLQLFEINNNKIGKLVCERDAYEDDGCYWIRHRDFITTDFGVDVVKYCICDDKVNNLMNQRTLEKYPATANPNQTYDYNYDDIFPFRKTFILGNFVNTPNKAEKLLSQNYGNYNVFVPVNDYTEWLSKFNSKFITSPFKVIKEYDSVSEALTSTPHKIMEPFIVRNCTEFNVTVDELKNCFINDKKVLSWYETETELFNEIYCDGSVLYQQWLNNSLKYNIVDAPNNNIHFLPKILQQNIIFLDSDSQVYSVCYSLTKRNNLTKYHIDALGDGWVYLTCGTKVWHLFSYEDLTYLDNNGYSLDAIKNMSFTELVHILDGYLWGKIYVTDMKANDFIYFPQKWTHRVITYDKSVGVSGYTKNNY